MTDYLSYRFKDNDDFIDTFDEAPLWSSTFGLLLLKHLNLKPEQTVVDLGSGAGFPLLELAGRLGNSCKLYGVDPWVNANKRTRLKINHYQYRHVELLEVSADKIPLEDGSVDLIVSNLGINNFDNPGKVFTECNRLLVKGGKLALTTNLTGHWKEFYTIFEKTLVQLGKTHLIPILRKDYEHRGTVQSIEKLYSSNGFKVMRHHEDVHEMKFLNGSAFLNHHFVKAGWLSTWLNIFPSEELEEIFSTLEANLNKHALASSGLNLTVPMLFMEGEK